MEPKYLFYIISYVKNKDKRLSCIVGITDSDTIAVRGRVVFSANRITRKGTPWAMSADRVTEGIKNGFYDITKKNPIGAKE